MEASLLERYRRDRRKLLDYLLSAGLAAEVRPPAGTGSLSDVDLDAISADYVLERVRIGGVLDLSEASKRHHEESHLPVMMNAQSGSSFYLISKPELSGTPPQRPPPHVRVNSYHSSCPAKQPGHPHNQGCTDSGIGEGIGDTALTHTPSKPFEDASIMSLGLPTLSTGLSNDDLRETAYEVLLASLIFSGVQIHPSKDKKKEKKSRFLTGLSSTRERVKSHSQSVDWHSDLLDIIRVQMEIPVALDACIKQGLVQFHSRSKSEQIGVPQISLELISNISKSDFGNEKLYTQWQKRQANILEELLHGSSNLVAKNGYTTLKLFLGKFRNTEEWTFRMNSNERAAILTSIRRLASGSSHVPGKFDLPGETYYWTSCYHLNVKLYEKLLCSVFDILEDGQIVEEAEEILSLLKLTWLTLGITQKMHDALYGWVLFQQFIGTGETMLLKDAVLQMEKTLLSENGDRKEEAYMNSLICTTGFFASKGGLNLIEAVLLSINSWCDSKLQDYHLHFSQDPVTFESVVILAVVLGIHFADKYGESKFNMGISNEGLTSKILKGFIESSVRAAYRRVLDLLDFKSKAEGKHRLAVFADDLKLIAEREYTAFSPVLCRWYPEAQVLSFIFLHQIYWEQLKPFLEGVSDLSENVRSVLPAADTLECCLTHILYSTHGEDSLMSSFISNVHPYQVGEICGPFILQWVNAQHESILKWTERAIHIEDWEPLSSQRRQATSIIEVFRIIEETIDQFFNLNLPMNIIHLRSLLIGIFQSLDTYLLQLASQLVDKKYLYPSTPTLTRHKEATNPFMKKKPVEDIVLEEKIINQLNNLTTSKLCVRLSTLHYIRDQIDMLEDAIKKSWMLVRPVSGQFPRAPKKESDMPTESIDELFTIFDDIRRSSFNASSKICDFIGARVIFWDMRVSFIYSLYRGNVENARLEIVIPHLDSILDQICDLIIDTLRDQVVLSICRASMEGYVWLLLDGGPSRVFSETDIAMVQEDLNILKDLFIASGEGLPCVVVEKEAYLAQQILDIYGLKTDTIIEMLISASEHISYGQTSTEPGRRLSTDADTLLRVLCHRKDREASKFLKRHYQLPKSSEYEDAPGKESVSVSPLISDLLKRSSSLRWTEKGHKSLRIMKQKFQEATSEIKYSPW